jgi:hypothetical protein
MPGRWVKSRRTQRAIGVELVLEDPFTGEEVGANGARDKIPGVVGDQGKKFFFHGMMQVWIDEGGVVGGGHQRQDRRQSGR